MYFYETIDVKATNVLKDWKLAQWVGHVTQVCPKPTYDRSKSKVLDVKVGNNQHLEGIYVI